MSNPNDPRRPIFTDEIARIVTTPTEDLNRRGHVISRSVVLSGQQTTLPLDNETLQPLWSPPSPSSPAFEHEPKKRDKTSSDSQTDSPSMLALTPSPAEDTPRALPQFHHHTLTRSATSPTPFNDTNIDPTTPSPPQPETPPYPSVEPPSPEFPDLAAHPYLQRTQSGYPASASPQTGTPSPSLSHLASHPYLQDVRLGDRPSPAPRVDTPYPDATRLAADFGTQTYDPDRDVSPFDLDVPDPMDRDTASGRSRGGHSSRGVAAATFSTWGIGIGAEEEETIAQRR